MTDQLITKTTKQTSFAKPPFTDTFAKRRFSFNHYQVDQVCLDDIAHALSQIPRFGGHGEFHWSVASHDLLCWEAAQIYYPQFFSPDSRPSPDLLAAILMQDAAKAYTGEMICGFNGRFPSLTDYCRQLQDWISETYGLSISDEERSYMQRIKRGVKVAEAVALGFNVSGWEHVGQPEGFLIPVNLAKCKYGIFERPISSVKGLFLRQLRQFICE